jgi:A/G-specific adenine glycosylase
VIAAPLQAAILDWYDSRGRSLPFRGTLDPYLVLVSEVMAQQTQIGRVGDAWLAFTTTFPTFERLAGASPADVLRAWRGLGYNRRALNLWRTARLVVDEHGGVLPHDLDALERLPGIGRYTARAVAAIAFGAPVGAVDTNVRRVVGRAIAGSTEVLAPAELQAIADASVPLDRPADWTHALMDVGATLCRPSRPACGECPARPWCRFAAEAARAAGDVSRAISTPPRGGSNPRGERASPFSASSRWLRGRILDRLREADGSSWLELVAPIGVHNEGAVTRTLALLAAEGLVERHPDSECTARLPIA